MPQPGHGALALLAVLTACSPTAPSVEEVAGNYAATTLTTREGGVTTDQLALGSSLTLVLAADGSTIGDLYVPNGAEDGGNFDAVLTGTWVLHGDTVEFDHAADTFVRDMPFVFDNDRLTGERTFSATTVRVVLTKQ
jgi:hypothetical protein